MAFSNVLQAGYISQTRPQPQTTIVFYVSSSTLECGSGSPRIFVSSVYGSLASVARNYAVRHPWLGFPYALWSQGNFWGFMVGVQEHLCFVYYAPSLIARECNLHSRLDLLVCSAPLLRLR